MKTIDKELRDAVLDAFEQADIDATNIGVIATDGAVTLTGFVHSPGQKHGAVRAAERVPGAGAVADELEVRLPVSPGRTDAEIAADIARERRWHPQLPDSLVVHVEGGHVTLRGDADSDEQRSEAEQVIGRVRGVRSVDNLVGVRPHPLPRHRDVERRADDAIRALADTAARSIRATVEGGTVRLEGTVHSPAERCAAEDAAAATPGVTSVLNEILVAP